MAKKKTTTKAQPRRRIARRPGRLIVVSGASGSGKTSLCRRLVETVKETENSVSYTTREPRIGELDGVHYHYIDDRRFDQMIKKRQFAEWAPVHNYRYGTGALFITKKLAAGVDVICDIDVQGGLTLRDRFKGDAILVFILPPTMAELERRLRTRATDSEIVIKRRLAAARKEHRIGRQYDFLLVNDDFVQAGGALADIVRAERYRTNRIKALIPKSLF